MGVRAASNEPGPRASNSHEEPTASLHCYATNKTHECHVLDHFAPECYARLGHSRLSSSSGGRRGTSSGSRLRSRLGSRSSLGSSSSSRGSSWCLLLFNLLSGSRSRSLGGRGCRSSGRLVLLRLLVLLGLLGGLRGLGSRSSSSYSDERSVSTSSATARAGPDWSIRSGTYPPVRQPCPSSRAPRQQRPWWSRRAWSRRRPSSRPSS